MAVTIWESWDCHERTTGPTRGDQGWHTVHRELAALHVEKASGYGTDEDALSNYVETADAVGEPPEYVCWLRVLEKAHRALNLIRAGRAADVDEGKDVAALGIAAEALRRRRD